MEKRFDSLIRATLPKIYWRKVEMKKQTEALPEPNLKEIPLLSYDQRQIKVNSILYRVKQVNSDRYSNKKPSIEIEALRVFYVNNTTRSFRVRCVKGCEEIFQVADKCVTNKLFGNIQNARNEVWRIADEWKSEKTAKKKAAEKDISNIIQARWKALRKTARLPKTVK